LAGSTLSGAPSNDPRALIRYALAGIALTLILLWAAYLVRNALLVIYISLLLATGLSPLVESLEQRRTRQRLPRWAAILIIYLALIGALVSVGILVVTPLVDQARALWAALPDLLHQAQQWLLARGWIGRELSIQEAVQQTPVGGSDAVGTVINAIWGLVGGIFGIVTILILTFYVLVDFEKIVGFFIRLFPRAGRARARDATHRVTTKVSAWLGGQLLLAGIIGSSAAIGLWAMGVPYFYVLALLAGVGEMIPMVGPILSAVPAVIVAFTKSPALGLGVLVFFVVQQQVENHLLVPKIMSRQVGISAVVVITALLIGGSLLGIMGAILAVPTAAILQVIFEELSPDDEEF
jgi:predicted PurR-regulated permease PerM